MSEFLTAKSPHCTAFRSAAEEVADASAMSDWWNKGRHMFAKSAKIVATDDAQKPYKAVFDHEDGGPKSEQACATMGEAEALVRQNLPATHATDVARDQSSYGLTGLKAGGGAIDEADASAGDEWANEGGHMRATSGYVVQTNEATNPYKVVLNHENADDTEQSCATMRQAEALIRRNTPTPIKRDASYDHEETAS